MQEVFIVYVGDNYDRDVIGVATSVAEAHRMAREYVSNDRNYFHEEHSYFSYQPVVLGTLVSWGIGTPNPDVDMSYEDVMAA